MENYKKTIENKELNEVAGFIFQNSLGNVIILSGVPTNAVMKANSVGIYGTDIYIKTANNVTLKLVGVNVP